MFSGNNACIFFTIQEQGSDFFTVQSQFCNINLVPRGGRSRRTIISAYCRAWRKTRLVKETYKYCCGRGYKQSMFLLLAQTLILVCSHLSLESSMRLLSQRQTFNDLSTLRTVEGITEFTLCV